jgi:phosphoribosyl 1,2-cyclic phosphodiesterase
MSMIVKFWGARGAIPVPGIQTQIYGGNTPCVEIAAGDEAFICDAGSGIRLLAENLKRRKSVPHRLNLLFSHAHTAHVHGIPFFEPLFNRSSPVRVYSSAPTIESLRRFLASAQLTPLSLSWERSQLVAAEFNAINGSPTKIGDLTVRTFPVNHADDCCGFSFEREGRKVVYIPDNELSLHKSDQFPDPRNESVLMRQMPQDLLKVVQGANLLIMDAQFTDETYATRRGSGHSSCISVTDFAIQAEVDQLALFHHDPQSTDLDLEANARLCVDRATRFGANLTIFPAREGMALEV